MGARALNEVDKGFYRVLGEAHVVLRPKIKAPTKARANNTEEVFRLGRSLAASAMARGA